MFSEPNRHAESENWAKKYPARPRLPSKPPDDRRDHADVHHHAGIDDRAVFGSRPLQRHSSRLPLLELLLRHLRGAPNLRLRPRRQPHPSPACRRPHDPRGWHGGGRHLVGNVGHHGRAAGLRADWRPRHRAARLLRRYLAHPRHLGHRRTSDGRLGRRDRP